jgi:hypothetical protein
LPTERKQEKNNDVDSSKNEPAFWREEELTVCHLVVVWKRRKEKEGGGKSEREGCRAGAAGATGPLARCDQPKQYNTDRPMDQEPFAFLL